MTHSHPSERIPVEVADVFQHLYMVLPAAEMGVGHLFFLGPRFYGKSTAWSLEFFLKDS